MQIRNVFSTNKLVRKHNVNPKHFSYTKWAVSCDAMPLHLRKAFWICIGFPNYFFEHFRFVFYSNTVKYWILSALIFRTNGFFARKNNNTKNFHWKSMQIKYKKSKNISIENQCKWNFPDFHPLVKKIHRFSTIKKNHC